MRHVRHDNAPEKSGVLSWVGQVLSWLCLLAVLGLVTVMVVIPQLFGSGSYTVLTGSMRPGMPPGSLIVTKEANPEELRIGEAITYQIRSGEPAVVTHRIIARTSSSDGITLTTQGDASPSPDEEQVRPEQIRGVVWYTLPLVGYVNGWLTGEQRIWAVGGAVVLLLGYTAFMFGSALIEGARSRRSAESVAGDVQ
ncbi:signal peptidase I [Arthrobacter sp.]|uniref:signal peptidase I n=1 Tax=Arthrobacter sp. TaxID=1667 RepID=UPI00281141C4|nr:signal peptidase I [Arthrobacter sp.]